VSRVHEGVEELRLHDLLTCLNVHRTGSVTAAARELNVTPSQVSKAIARIEGALHLRIFTRGPRGIGLSSAGRQVLPKLEQVATLLRSLGRAEKAPEGELTIAAPSSLLPPILPKIINALPGMRVRGIELPPALLRGYAGEELFDLALLPGVVTGLPSKWVTTPIGELKKSLFATPAVARKLGSNLAVEDIRSAPFVGPIVYDGGKFVSSTDDCPLGLEERVVASEVGTMALALQIAVECGHLVFGPAITAQGLVRDGALVELEVKGWNVSETLFLACDAERVLARVQATIVDAIRAALLGPGDHAEDGRSSPPSRRATKANRS
jgi:DNA-binding transcriptional LysR family regulator